jgi:N-acetylglucosaminyl-diphospho-decaprenol L-rhamnosyltransferase
MNHHAYIEDLDLNFFDRLTILAITVSYRTAKLIVDGLAALKFEVDAQPGLGIVIVDNTCGEDAPIIQAAIDERGWGAWAKVIVAQHNGGYAYGNNLPIRKALLSRSPPKYYWLLNPDTEVHPGATQALVDFMERDARIGITGSALLMQDDVVWNYAFRFPSLWSEFERGAAVGVISRLLRSKIVAREMSDQPEQVDWLPGASMMVRREVFESIGLLDEKYFLYYEETDFILQARNAGWTCWYVPASRVMHIAGASSGVTSRENATKRKPQYLFDSRRRYFIKNHGWAYTVATDTAFCMGVVICRIKHWITRRPSGQPRYLLWDSLRNHSLIKPKI